MQGLSADIVSDDFASFQTAPPGEVSMAKKIKEQAEKMKKRDEAVLRPKQFEAAAKLVEVTKHEDEREDRANLIRKIHAYQKKFPQRLKGIILTPAKEAKADVEDLKRVVLDIEHELGKGASAKMLTSLHVFGLVQFEETTKVWNPLNLRIENLGQVAQSNAEQVLEPLWEEFAIKHSEWFSQSVETRLIMATAEMIAVVHRMNGQAAQQTIHKAATTPANEEILKKAAELAAKSKKN